MTFHIPEDLSLFSVAGLKKLEKDAQAAYSVLFSTVDSATVTADELQETEDLQTFTYVTLPAAIVAAQENEVNQQSLTAKFNNLRPPTPTTEDEPAAVTAATSAPSVADVVAAGGGTRPTSATTAVPRYASLVAATGIQGYAPGSEFASMLEVAKAFEAASMSHSPIQGSAPVITKTPIAQLRRDYPEEFSVNGDESDYDKLLKVADEKRLPGGSLLDAVEARRKQIAAEGGRGDSLVAAAGWCAPSEIDYSICLQISTDGIADWPEVQARRGGIKHNTGIAFNQIFGGGTCATGQGPTGFFNLSEANVAAGTTKTCLEIPCPPFVDTRLGVTGVCLTGNILSIRGYPEMTETFTRGAIAVSAHQVNREQIAAVVAASVATDLTSVAPWATDGSTISQVMSAVEMAAVDIKYNMRMQQSATLEVVMPWWILAQMRADWIRRAFVDGDSSDSALALMDASIDAGFRARGVRVNYVYDWQDAFAVCSPSGVANAVGGLTPITQLPKTLQFCMYPAGTWIRAVQDVITLNNVYDSTKLATNQVTHLFTETGWAMVQMCPVTRVYTVPICPSGKTTQTGTLTCP